MDSDRIEANFTTLMQQATDTTATYLMKAKREIDEVFGEGYAANNPALIAAFIASATADFNNACAMKVLGSAIDRVAAAIENGGPFSG